MTMLPGVVVERVDADGYSKIAIEVGLNRYSVTVRTEVANENGYEVGVPADIDVTDGGATVRGVTRRPAR